MLFNSRNNVMNRPVRFCSLTTTNTTAITTATTTWKIVMRAITGTKHDQNYRQTNKPGTYIVMTKKIYGLRSVVHNDWNATHGRMHGTKVLLWNFVGMIAVVQSIYTGCYGFMITKTEADSTKLLPKKYSLHLPPSVETIFVFSRRDTQRTVSRPNFCSHT